MEKESLEELYSSVTTRYPVEGYQPVLDMLAPDVIWRAPGSKSDIPWGGVWRGKKGVHAFFNALWNTVEIVENKELEHSIDGDHISALYDVTFRVRDTGVTATVRREEQTTLRDGMITAYEEVYDLDELKAYLTPGGVSDAH